MKVLFVLLVFLCSLVAFANDELWQAAKNNNRAEVERILAADPTLGLDYIPLRRARNVRWHLRRFGHNDIIARVDAGHGAGGARKVKREREVPAEGNFFQQCVDNDRLMQETRQANSRTRRRTPAAPPVFEVQRQPIPVTPPTEDSRLLVAAAMLNLSFLSHP